jgi:hypothetical protein
VAHLGHRRRVLALALGVGDAASILWRNLVYTAVTRGQRLVVFVGQPKALALAVKGAQTRRRWSKLGEWLGGGEEGSPPAGDVTGGNEQAAP